MKKGSLIPQILIAVAITFVIAMSVLTANGKNETKVNTAEGQAYLAAAGNADVREIENRINSSSGSQEDLPGETYVPLPDETSEEKELGVEKFYGSNLDCYVPWTFNPEKAEKAADDVASGTVSTKEVFSDTLFVGDSIMTGFRDFKLADEGNVIATVGAFLQTHLYDNIDAIISYNPKFLVLHYGLNEMDPDDFVTDAFINRYKECIQKIKEGVPGIRIVVCGLMPVQESAVQQNARLAYAEKYNKKLRSMCVELGVGYNEDSELFASHPELYAGDGIHVQKKLYVMWIDNLIREMGIYNVD